jgi:trigger factor
MNVQVENLPNCITTLRVEIPPDKVTKTREGITRDIAGYARIPGFRPGKAPRHIVEKKFQKEIREELQKKLLSESCRAAIDEKHLRVISVAEVEDVEIGDDKAMRFTATLVTAPEFELPDYRSIPLETKQIEVTDAEVDESLENLRNQAADFSDITDRPLQMDDFAVIDYTGTIDGRPVHELFPKAGKPLSGNHDFWIRLTPESFFPGFSANLAGASAGETRSFDIEVPADFAVQELAGQKIHYEVTIKGLKQKQLPELNDEFAARMVPGATLASLRELARKELLEQKSAEAERNRKNEVMSYLLSKVECELPANLVRYETQRILGDIVRENQARGVADELLKENEKDLVGAASQGARERLKGSFILQRIAEAEKITVSREEFRARVAQLAQRYGLAPDKMLKELEKRDAMDQIYEEVLAAKTLDFLTSGATVAPSPAATA